MTHPPLNSYSFLLNYLVRQYESQLQNKSKTGEFSNVDLKQLMDRIESLSIRAEGNEKNKMITNGTNAHNGDHSDRNSDDNENSQKAEFEQTIVALKESILQLDTERDALQNLLTQREKKIELLEEDLRGPVPYEMGRRVPRNSSTLCGVFDRIT